MNSCDLIPGKLYRVSIIPEMVRSIDLFRTMLHAAAPYSLRRELRELCVVDVIRRDDVILYCSKNNGPICFGRVYQFIEIISPQAKLGWIMTNVRWYTLIPFEKPVQ